MLKKFKVVKEIGYLFHLNKPIYFGEKWLRRTKLGSKWEPSVSLRGYEGTVVCDLRICGGIQALHVYCNCL